MIGPIIRELCAEIAVLCKNLSPFSKGYMKETALNQTDRDFLQMVQSYEWFSVSPAT